MAPSTGKTNTVRTNRPAIPAGDLSLLSRLKVLIIDDEPEALDVTRFMLALYQAEVIACLNGVEGLERLQAHRHDVIVCDINMPQMNGYQFIQAVRSLTEDKSIDTPAIALCAG